MAKKPVLLGSLNVENRRFLLVPNNRTPGSGSLKPHEEEPAVL